ncbi:MAG: hypothetical protein JXX28_08160 [Deltaproteobacteria bacterium]|nr:hypothetical protein [Deltaproteobacteria bacterium]
MLWLLFAACGGSSQRVTVITPEALSPAFEDFVAFLPWDDKALVVDPQPDPSGPGLEIGVVLDQDCAECWYLEPVGRDDWRVHAGDALGAQYGVAEVLEGVGFRFHHPHAQVAPCALSPAVVVEPARLRRPEIARRGLHLHTLHPIEALFDFEVPSADGQERAARVIDWMVKNRGDHLEWFALDNLLDPLAQQAWEQHVAPILERAHARGVSTGIGIQLFGAANLQQGFDLLDVVGSSEEQEAEMRDRLGRLLTDRLPWDVVYVSFGEFFDEEPEAFLDSAQRMTDVIHDLSPEVEVVGKVHVGDDLHVTYLGEDQIFYFLVQYLRDVTPWVHTVMYYNLFDDPGGSYHHQDYEDHRELLLRLIGEGREVGYFPESAYWVAFDDSVPTYLPVYQRSRWEDLRGIQQAGVGPLPQHVLFSSGWEWGYWQTDVSTLRMSFALPERWTDPLREALRVHPQGDAVTDLIGALGDAQYELLIGQRLAPWLAGEDGVMAFGATQGIVAQPLRPSFASLAALQGDERAATRAELLPRLAALRQIHQDAVDALAALGVGREDPFLAELEDGLAVDVARAGFVEALADATLADDPGPALALAEDALAAGREAVTRRHAALLDPEPARLITQGANPTIYPAGYLYHADTLCYWERERAQVRNLLLGEQAEVPGCVR